MQQRIALCGGRCADPAVRQERALSRRRDPRSGTGREQPFDRIVRLDERRLDHDEAELDDMEDCIEIDSYLLSKEDYSTSTSTTIASTLTETTIGEFLDKDEQIEKDSTPIPW